MKGVLPWGSQHQSETVLLCRSSLNWWAQLTISDWPRVVLPWGQGWVWAFPATAGNICMAPWSTREWIPPSGTQLQDHTNVSELSLFQQLVGSQTFSRWEESVRIAQNSWTRTWELLCDSFGHTVWSNGCYFHFSAFYGVWKTLRQSQGQTHPTSQNSVPVQL